jgi:hypothetical protein
MQTLLAGLYLGWLFQSVCLQHAFDYVQVPPILLGLTLVAGWCSTCEKTVPQPLVFLVFTACVLLRFPSLCLNRLETWGDCLRDGSTPALRDRLTLLPKASWRDLDCVKDFLRHQEVKDGELTCMHMAPVSLYGDLGVKPATRFNFVQNFLVILSRQRNAIYGELAISKQRFIVCDVEGYGMEKLQAALQGDAPYPWLDRIVFRSGPYVVFRLSGPETPQWFEATSRLPNTKVSRDP